MAVATKRGIRYHPQGAACRGEAPPRPYVLVVYPHVIDGLGPDSLSLDIHAKVGYHAR